MKRLGPWRFLILWSSLSCLECSWGKLMSIKVMIFLLQDILNKVIICILTIFHVPILVCYFQEQTEKKHLLVYDYNSFFHCEPNCKFNFFVTE